MKKMKRGHGKQEDYKKNNFCNLRKWDLRTGFRCGHLTLEGPGAPLGVKSAISVVLGGKSVNSLKLPKSDDSGRKSHPSAPLPQNRTMRKVLKGSRGVFSANSAYFSTFP